MTSRTGSEPGGLAADRLLSIIERVECLNLFLAGERVLDHEDDRRLRLHPCGREISPRIMPVLAEEQAYTYRGDRNRYVLPGRLAPLHRRTEDGSYIWTWAAQISERVH